MKVGQTVICIDDSIKNQGVYNLFKNWVKKDSEYTIRQTRMSLEGGLSLLLEEIINPPIYVDALKGYAEPGFSHDRFRKVELKTNSINEEMEALI